MVRHGVLIMGPAGCGKSTLCYTLQQQYEVSRHRVVCINLDPAAEYMPYEPDIDIRELISADEAAEELHLGPNGSLVFCIEYLEKNKEWLEEKILTTCEDDLLLFDLPGQIELYIHLDAFRHIFSYLERQGLRLCVAYCLDITFFSDPAKSISGSLLALNAMLFFELPHVNIFTKCDLVAKVNITRKARRRKRESTTPENISHHSAEPPLAAGPSQDSAATGLSTASSRDDSEEEHSGSSDEEEGKWGSHWAGRWLDSSPFGQRIEDADADETEEDVVVEQLLAKDVQDIVEELDENMPARYQELHRAFASVLEEFGLVSFFPLNILNENAITSLGALLRSTLQADEEEEPRMDYDYQQE
ncbi:GPN-loop GTPase 3 [Cyclospora cayetanensis]|uniref:GPN-loop GTPase 3 n=1 Tax=Cyclospora cayetanensis TaxID=88456 RepID=A0A6P6S2X5_9EIME|nr:GPN-loop GTPase 3 [Cyclospora cayetanensis]